MCCVVWLHTAAYHKPYVQLLAEVYMTLVVAKQTLNERDGVVPQHDYDWRTVLWV